MVLKRKLPSAMAAKPKKEEQAAAKEASATPEVPENPFADLPPLEETAPIAPEPKVDATSSAIPEVPDFPFSDENDKSLEAKEKEEAVVETDSIMPWAEEPSMTEPQNPSSHEAGSMWDLPTPGEEAPTGDVFGTATPEASMENPQSVSSADLPPWQQGVAGSNAAPELPKSKPIEQKIPEIPVEQANNTKVGLFAVVVIGVIAFAGYQFFSNKDKTAEVVSRWTGSLNEVSEEIPVDANQKINGKAQSVLEPETVVSMDQANRVADIMPSEEFSSKPEPMVEPLSEDPEMVMEDEIPYETQEIKVVEAEDLVNESSSKPESVVEFVDVPEEDVYKPIDAKDEEPMPEEVGVIVQLQQAIKDARHKKNPEDFKTVDTSDVQDSAPADNLDMLSPEEIDARNDELSRQLEEELAEYRRILNSGAQGTPKPSQFFKGQDETVAQPTTGAGAIPLPTPKGGTSSLLTAEQANNLYGANPKGLPTVSPPQVVEKPSVRTLDDFDVSMFEPERERVRIPKGIRPSFRATNFPPLTILSIVAGQGIIAETRNKQGVLLVGESVDGWELISVNREYAEFSNGKRKHVVTVGR